MTLRRPLFYTFNCVLLILLFGTTALTQVVGEVKDQDGNALPFVNIYVKNTTIGTTTNMDGLYNLKCPKGQQTIVFQFIGFISVERDIMIADNPITVDIEMQPNNYNLDEILISANAEDPAYAIIRKAQEKRKYYLEAHSNYVCDAYVKGFNKIYDAPEKIMGFDIGDLDGTLDSTRQGIIYLSESVSKLYVKDGQSKEVMFSSKVSGNDQGYSFNSAQEMDFNMYNNTLSLNRNLVSPIANNAMQYYEYKLIGANYNEDGQLVNKILVTPKNNFGPVFHGYVYINEDLWNFHSFELSASKEATQIPFIDTLTFTQNFVPVENNKHWAPLTNLINFKMSALGFKVGGNFVCAYSNYQFNTVDDDIFNNEVFKVESSSNSKSDTYWNTVRPVPLTSEEELDYHRKDSIRIVKESPAYLDSIDREHNKFKFGDILSGYSHQNSQAFTNWTINSPASTFQVNTIQGWHANLGISYNKSKDKLRTRSISYAAKFDYGFSDQQFRPNVEINFLANSQKYNRLIISGGRKLQQINQAEPISPTANTFFTLIERENYLKAYDSRFFKIQYSQYLTNPIFARFSIKYDDRKPEVNTYDGSLFYKDARTFSPNISGFESHQALSFNASFRIKFGQEVWSYPDRKFYMSSKYPTIWLHYKKAISVFGTDVAYDLLHASVRKTVNVGVWGSTQFFVHGGIFLNAPEQIIDYMHFQGNQLYLTNPSNYQTGFLNLPYYSNSTNGNFLQIHMQHHFNGAILSKLPLFKKLGWQLVGGYKLLSAENSDLYQEIHLGLDNIGFKIFRLLRVDAVWSLYPEATDPQLDFSKFAVRVGIKL